MLLGALLATAGFALGSTLNLTAHSATGKTYTATATVNSLHYDDNNGVVTVSIEFTSPQILCSGFGNQE